MEIKITIFFYLKLLFNQTRKVLDFHILLEKIKSELQCFSKKDKWVAFEIVESSTGYSTALVDKIAAEFRLAAQNR